MSLTQNAPRQPDPPAPRPERSAIRIIDIPKPKTTHKHDEAPANEPPHDVYRRGVDPSQPRLHEVPRPEQERCREQCIRVLVERGVLEMVVDQRYRPGQESEERAVERCEWNGFAIG